MRVNNVIYVIIISMFFFACKTTNVGSSKPSRISDVHGVWNLQDEDQTALGIGNNPITLIFDPTSRESISGFAGCNNYGGNIEGDNGYITFKDIYSTKMSCPTLNEEDNYLNLLEKVNRFEVVRNDLYLYKDKLLLLHFKK
ncbi:META domain-containing protein [Flavobacteriaceae bacterium Ap0902]|nr:META domain-containing protein [Flavobacteriaceae bacterium Ap0902]